MKNDIRSVWERYVSSWNAQSAAEKRALFAECLARDCVYRDPQTEARGWDELSAWMAGFQQQMPGTRFVTASFWAHHGRSVARWRMLSAAGVSLDEGISYGEYDAEQRLVAMTAFFDAPEASESA
jgi:hypothetical protein